MRRASSSFKLRSPLNPIQIKRIYVDLRETRSEIKGTEENTCTRIKKKKKTRRAGPIEWNLPSQVVKASPGVRVPVSWFQGQDL